MELSRQECNILKGWAIIMIMIHNYCRRLPNATIENEFTWRFENTYYFQNHYLDSLFTNIFSFWGHYGVVIFVFLSGYGLVKKYEFEAQNIFQAKAFIKNHYTKLTILLFGGTTLYWITNYILHNELKEINFYQIVAQLTYIVNIIPMKYLGIYPGPYWYFGMTMELYILYILIIYKKKNIVTVSVCIICLLTLCLSNGHYQMLTWLKLNFIGSFLPFTIGILFARAKLPIPHIPPKTSNIIIEKASLITLGCIFIIPILIFEMNFYLWLLSSIPILCFAICIVKLYHGIHTSIAEKIGRTSNILFVIHPIIREIPLTYKYYMDNYPLLILFVYIGLTFIFTIPFKIYLSYANKLFQSKISERTP